MVYLYTTTCAYSKFAKKAQGHPNKLPELQHANQLENFIDSQLQAAENEIIIGWY